ncbi:MAG: AglZ/HisF2 family acetamidino modification protein [Acidobacteriota bacterium]|nr:AglZ/HisF2 family acetamidino modification protein [Acidobacteriota bacterium]
MLRTRVIPCLLLRRGGLVKTVKFADAKYVGDPINAVRIFNDKEVDELILLDIDATREKREPDYDRIQDMVSEAFMPVAYGGGVRTVEHASRIISLGVEKVVVNHGAQSDLDLVSRMAARLGSSSTVVAVDVKRDWLGRRRVYDHAAGKVTSLDPVSHLLAAVSAGAGEVFLNDVDRDGTGKGFDLEMIREIAGKVRVPVIACGGAGAIPDLRAAADAGASAVAAGSLFVYVGRHRAVMINYPPYRTLVELFSEPR